MTEEAAKKGRPTPSRKDSESKRKVSTLAPIVTKDQKRASKALARQNRIATRAAYLRGDEAALPARDRGPVKRFVRDYVDSRRSLGEYFLPLMIFVLALTLIPSVEIRFIAIIFMYGAMLYSVVYGFFVSKKIKQIVAERFPGESAKGLGMYGWLRSTQMRKLRAPAPQKKLGDKV